MTATIAQDFTAINDFASGAGYAVEPFGPGWGYACDGSRWIARKYTRGNREVGVFADAHGAVTGGTVRIDGGNAKLLTGGEVIGALLAGWAPVSLIKN